MMINYIRIPRMKWIQNHYDNSSANRHLHLYCLTISQALNKLEGKSENEENRKRKKKKKVTLWLFIWNTDTQFPTLRIFCIKC